MAEKRLKPEEGKERVEWKRGYWQDPTWQQAPLEPGNANEIVKKYREQLARFRASGGNNQWKRKVTTFDDMVARDEARLEKAKARMRNKRAAVAESEPSGSDIANAEV